MKRDELGDLVAFLAVADERSFTRAAAKLATSQSSLSHTVRRLEERMGVRLLTRTTRKVALTDAGETLAGTLRPALDGIETTVGALTALRMKPAGTIRITTSRRAARTLIMPAATRLMRDYPDVTVELSIDQRFIDVVAERFDAGVRLGEEVDRDMIAVRIGPELRMAVVGAPSYFAAHPKPETPHDLTRHACINLRLPTLGGLYAWEFGRDDRALNVRVGGPFICNDVATIIDGALAGLGLASLPEDEFDGLIAEGRLVRVLDDWCPPFPGYHLYYPSRRQVSPAFGLLVEALRWRG